MDTSVQIMDSSGLIMDTSAQIMDGSVQIMDTSGQMIESTTESNRALNEIHFHSIVKDSVKLRSALDLNNKLVFLTDKNGWGLLHYVCVEGDSDCFELLIERKCDIKLKDIGGNTSLHIACRYGHLKISERLIELGGDIKLKNKVRNTPMDCVVGGNDIVCLANLGKCRQPSTSYFSLLISL